MPVFMLSISSFPYYARAAYAYQQSQALLNGMEDVWKWIAVIQEENAYQI
jgi:hypothetical protein